MASPTSVSPSLAGLLCLVAAAAALSVQGAPELQAPTGGQLGRLSCANVRCSAGHVCQQVAGRPRCVASPVVGVPRPPGTGGTKPARPDCANQFSCIQIYQPVCGSDGQTYGNSCDLRSAACSRQDGLTQVGEGPCAAEPTGRPADCPDACVALFAPVCGSNGRTYGNDCELKVDACKRAEPIKIASEGPCADKPPTKSWSKPPAAISRRCPVGCPKNVAPVCGSNGKTYANECLLRQAACNADNPELNLQVRYKGRCVFEPECQ